MARVEGEGSDGLDFSSHTYEELRTAVFAVDEEAIRVGANEWGDLRRRLNERIGTLRVMIHKLEPDWGSGAGRQALGRLRSHLSRMQTLAKTARWNEDRFDTLYETYTTAVKDLRALDATRGGQAEVASNPGGAEPLPPHLADRRQPRAAKIANTLYRQIALTGATLTIPGEAPHIAPDDGGTGAPGGDSESPGNGAGTRPPGGSDSPGTTSGSPGTVMPPPSKIGTPGRGPVLAGSSQAPSLIQPSGGGNPGQTPAGTSTSGGGGFGVTPAARAEFGATGRGGVGTGGAGGASRGVIGPPRGVGGAGAPPGGDHGVSTLGGPPPRPGVGAPGGGPPAHPGMAGGHGGPATPGRDRPGRRTNYERGEPDLFVDQRHRARPVLGQQLAQSKPVSAGPGVIGQQKQKAADAERHEQQHPQPAPSPEGFPDKLENGSFRSRDGAQFTVRRRGGGQ